MKKDAVFFHFFQKTELFSHKSEAVKTEKLLSIEEQATMLRGKADKLSKEAAELRRQAEALVPTKRNVRKKAE